MEKYDVLIVGAGVVGTAIARELSRYRLKVAILEKESELSFGVSKSNSGIIHPGTQCNPQLLKSQLCVAGNRSIRRVARELGVDFKEVGELIVAFTPEEVSKLLELKKDGEKLKVPRLQIVSQPWLRKNEPNLSPHALAALFAPTAGIISPYRLTYDLGENAVRNGVAIYTETKVEAIDFTNPGFKVYASKRSFVSDYLINACGLYADEISAMVGITDFVITPRKGEEFLLDKKRENMTNHLIFPLPSKKSKGVLVIKTADGNPMIGPTAVDQKDKSDILTSDQGFKEVISSVQRLVPSINPSDIIAYFAGLRPSAGEDFIIRHENSVFGFVNVAGIQSPGLTAAVSIAEYVSRILKDIGLDLKRKLFFHKTRKRTIHLFNLNKAQAERIISKEPEFADIVCRCEMISKKEVSDAISRGAKTLDGIKFRTRLGAGRCHGGFCTSRALKILSEETDTPITKVTKRGGDSYIINKKRFDD